MFLKINQIYTKTAETAAGEWSGGMAQSLPTSCRFKTSPPSKKQGVPLTKGCSKLAESSAELGGYCKRFRRQFWLGRRQVEELSVRRTEYVRSAPSSALLPNARGQKRLRRITLNWKFHFTPFNAVWHSSTEVPAQGIRGDRFRGSAPIAKEFRVASRRLLLRFFLLIQWRVALPVSRIGCSLFA